MQPSLFPPTDPLEQLTAHFGFTLRKSLHEFEVIAEAVSRGFQATGSLEEVYDKAITFLYEVIENEIQENERNQKENQ